MTYLKYTVFISLIAISFCACDDENLNNIAANQFVVEAFLYEGEPIDDIRVKTVFPLLDAEDTSDPINNAVVTIQKGSQTYNLVASGTDGYYNYQKNDLSVDEGDVFQLTVTHNGITATAETTVPPPTTGLAISQDTVKVPRLPLSQGRDSITAVIQRFVGESRIEATWDNPDRDFHFMVVESVKDTLDPIFIDQVIDALSRFRFVSEPTEESSLTFLSGTVVSFGEYSVKVYRINKEYTDLYENRNQDSRDLNEPPSNVENALGVFSAFNSAETFFYVVRE